MVKITNAFGDEKRGKQELAVYQGFYGQQIRRALKERKNADTKAQRQQRQRFRAGIKFARSLTKSQRDFLKSYIEQHKITGNEGQSTTWYTFAKKIAMTEPRVLMEIEKGAAPFPSPYMLWQYRRPITATNEGAALDNYQVCIELTADNFNYSHVKEDGSDIRFTAASGTSPLPYWIETWNYNGISKIWVKFNTIPQGTNHCGYIYYGNPTAQSESNGNETFEFFDNFEGTAMDTNKWTLNAVNNIAYEINNYFRFKDVTKHLSDYWVYDGTDTGSQHQAKWTPMSDFIVEFTSKISDNAAAQMGQGMVALVADDNTIIAGAGHQDWTGHAIEPRKGITAEDENGTTSGEYAKYLSYPFYNVVVSDGDEQNWKIEHYGTTIKVYDSSGLAVTLTRSSTLSKLALMGGGYNANSYLNYVEIRNLRVRKYAATEPSMTLGTEEQNSPDILKSFTIHHPALLEYEIVGTTIKETNLSNLTDRITTTITRADLNLLASAIRVKTLSGQEYVFPVH